MAKQGEGTGGEERIFVRDGFKSFRKTYRVREVYWGAGTGALLIGIVGWVGWKGAHPDPSLFDMSAALEGSAPAQSAAVDAEPRRAAARLGAPRAEQENAEQENAEQENAEQENAEQAKAGAGGAERGPLPAGLAAGGYREGKISQYSSDNLYIKINGRAGFFQSFGVKSLHTLTLEGPASEGTPSSVDVEAYDLGESRNAIGAYNGERPPGAESTVLDGSTFHFDRNAAFLARGPYYVRFIGSDESPQVVAEVKRLLDVFRGELPGEALPWGFSLFVDQLKLSASSVTYVKTNAFSFGFARDVYKAQLSAADSKEDMEVFVVACADPAAATAMAAQYAEGFASMGAAAGQTPGKVKLFKDEFLGSMSAATTVERWVIGVRGAPDAKRAAAELERLKQGITALPEDVRARAVPSTDLNDAAGEYGGGAAEPAPPSGGEAAGTPAAAEPGEDEGKPAEESSDEY